MPSSKSEMPQLRPNGGAPEIFSELMPSVYHELRGIAAHYFRSERKHHTLQPTELVHEAFIRIFQNGPAQYKNRAHFFGVISRVMCQILVDHARRRHAQKRPGAWPHVPLEEANVVFADPPDCLALDEALTRLRDFDPRLCQLAELRLFGGFSTTEAAAVLGRASSTVRRDWRIARIWLQLELESAPR